MNTSVVRRWVAKGQLKPSITTPGGHYRFSEASLAEFTHQPTPSATEASA